MRNHPAVKDPRRWRRLRRRILDRDGWRCRECGRAGRLEVDHVKRVQDGGAWWDEANLWALCRNHHFRKSARELARPVSPEAQAWRDLVAELSKRDGSQNPPARGGA